MRILLLFSQVWLNDCIPDLMDASFDLFKFICIVIVIRFLFIWNVTLLDYTWLRCELWLCLWSLCLKILLRLIFQWTVFVQIILVNFLMSNFVYKKLFEIQLRIMKLFLNISKNARIDNSISSMQRYFMFLIRNDRIDFISFCVDLLQIVLKLFYFSF